MRGLIKQTRTMLTLFNDVFFEDIAEEIIREIVTLILQALSVTVLGCDALKGSVEVCQGSVH